MCKVYGKVGVYIKFILKMSTKKYKDVDSNLNSVKNEKEMLNYWAKNNVFEKVKEKIKDLPQWVYYDGPITANNLPHYGHAITWTVKDAVPRYWTMQGFNVIRNIGWDCQGLPVEYEVEKKQGFEKKEDIEDFGVEKFNKLCKQSVLEYRGSMEKYETRLGRWLDHSDEYSTMDSSYIESIWWSIKNIHEKGLLYKGFKVVPYSTRAGTTLSNAEVALGGYKEITDPAITVKFKVVSKGEFEGNYILAWTTTPWTIPGNLMLAVGKNIEYSVVESGGVKYIVASDCIENVFDKKEYKVLKKGIKSKMLNGIEYKQPFNYFEHKRKEGCFKVIYADHVTTQDGTGIVHLAPYGEEDFNIFMDLGVTLFDYLDETGNFIDPIEKYKGMFYKKANKYIIEDLKDEGVLFEHSNYPHQMPMCWRTDTPLIYKPVESWYLSVTKIKKSLLRENNSVNWVPPHVKKGRFGKWLEEARDWALSRKRYWGTPIPIWVNDKTGDRVVIGSFKELSSVSGKKLSKDFDPHRPYVDDITWKGKEGGTFTRVPDVLDVWYDSGSMPFAQYHYPFKNKEKFGDRFPADFISESSDQTRGWFYSLIVINTALFDKTPYKNVSMSGMLLGNDGQKLSKSKKNYPPMDEVFETFGADILRYFLLTSPVVRSESAKFSNEFLNEVKKEYFSTLWNSYKYYVTYAKAYEFSGKIVTDSDNILDKWILTRLNNLVEKLNGYMKKYEIMYATRLFAPFVQDLSTWYIRRSRDRISKGDREALNTLYTCLNTLSKLMAPFMPFISDEIYLNITPNASDSVHLETYPKANKDLEKNDQILTDMQTVRDICSKGNAIRKIQNIPVRQPLALLEVVEKPLDDKYIEIIKDELNVKKVNFVKKLTDGDNLVISENVSLYTVLNEELVLEGEYRNLVRQIQSFRKDQGLDVEDVIEIVLEKSDVNERVLKVYQNDLQQKVGAKSVHLGAKTVIKKL